LPLLLQYGIEVSREIDQLGKNKNKKASRVEKK
jgi:hypothetical protein